MNSNTNPAQLIIDFPNSFNVSQGHTGDDAFSQLSVDIPADIMDRIAIAWCKKRGLHGALGGPVGLEFGSVDCDYDEHASENLEEDAELLKLVKEREGQPEIEANLKFDNIFDVVASTKEEAQRLKQIKVVKSPSENGMTRIQATYSPILQRLTLTTLFRLSLHMVMVAINGPATNVRHLQMILKTFY